MSATRAHATGPLQPIAETGAPALELEGVSSGHGSANIIDSVNLTVGRGEVVALLGSNGAGKTTLLRTVAGLITPSAGAIRIDGADVTRTRPDRRFADGLCLIPEGRGVFRNLTVRENIVMQSRTGAESEGIERATSAFPVLGQRLEQRAGTLSGGQQQMLAVAAAYVRDPSLVLVDEASLGLAPIVVEAIFEFLEGRSALGTSLLIVDQFVTRALAMSTRAYVMGRGRIVYSGKADTLADRDVFALYLDAGGTSNDSGPDTQA